MSPWVCALLLLAAVTPPELQTFVEAPYPPGQERVAAQVALILTIDATGLVAQVDIKHSGGMEFDLAAEEAARQFVFKPALRDGTPVGARIVYTYVFTPPIQPATANEPMLEAPIDVTVVGKSPAQKLRESAQAVVVIETLEAKQQSADLGEVLARTSQVSVQRQGGLGSPVRLSLTGFSDQQIRYFLDAVPLELAGFPYGVGNVPVNWVDRMEIYRGVVPIRFGADALGGAINLVTDQGEEAGFKAAASYQVGSFGTHRATLSARYRHAETGLMARGSFFLDHATNNYWVDVLAPNTLGQLLPAHVQRFHDVYGAVGGRLELGVVDQPWAKRLLARAFVVNFNRQLQTNILMTLPYGEPWTGDTAWGVSLDYGLRLGDGSLDAVVGYSPGVRRFVDEGMCIWSWFGQCVGQRRVGGEITPGTPHDDVFSDQGAFARISASWRWSDWQTFSAAVAPTWATRSGHERLLPAGQKFDALNAKLSSFATVLGLEHQLRVAGDFLENQLFVKEYLQVAHSQELFYNGVIRNHDHDNHQTGAGDAVRVWLTSTVYAKASYEYATRLPDPEEIFGDAALITDNLDLLPEVSHNGNLSVATDGWASPVGRWRGAVHGFWREATQLIVMLSNDAFSQYQNIASARALGGDVTVGWMMPGEYVAVDLSGTYQDFRNTSTQGTFQYYRGDRIPDIPYLFANGSVKVLFHDVIWRADHIMAQWNSRYVHEFYRGWESAGLKQYKQTVDAQLIHSVAATYVWKHPEAVVSLAFEVQNLTDARAYDFYGAQKPGRAYYFKTTVEL